MTREELQYVGNEIIKRQVELLKEKQQDWKLGRYSINKAWEDTIKEICQLKAKENFPQISVVLITHGSEFETKEIMEFGQTTKDFATKVEELWQSLMQEYLTFSEQSMLLRLIQIMKRTQNSLDNLCINL